MKGKELEEVCLQRLRQEEDLGRATMSRCGVTATFVDGEWKPIFSLPDFSGLLPPYGQEFVFDAKVCSGASFELRDDKFKRRQYKHMIRRDRFGAICFLLIHFSERILKRSYWPVETWAFPVSQKMEFWVSFEAGEIKSLTREHCREYAAEVEWNILPGGRTPRPDVVMAVYDLAARLGKVPEAVI